MHLNHLTAAEKQALFFKSQTEAAHVPGWNGTLYLLRCDIRDSLNAFVWRDENTNQLKSANIWPRAMMVLAGIDLLAKFRKNKDGRNVGTRFEEFVTDRITNSETNPNASAKVIYQLRNSLLHSFGLFSESRNNQGAVTATYRFTVQYQEQNWLIDNPQADEWRVNLHELEARFEASVDQYRQEITDGNRPFSDEMFCKYGAVFIG